MTHPSKTLSRLLIFVLIPTLICLTGCGSSRQPSGKGRTIQSGVASWYGPNFHGKKTANGEHFNQNALTAAHKTLPFNTMVRVINQDNGKSVTVRINDRGPYAKNRIIDLSRGAAKKIGMISSGTARVKLVLVKGDASAVANSTIKTGGKEIFTVQLASYDTKSAADRKARSIKNAWVASARAKGKTVYRVYYGRYSNKSSADKARKSLAGRGLKGFVKQVQN